MTQKKLVMFLRLGILFAQSYPEAQVDLSDVRNRIEEKKWRLDMRQPASRALFAYWDSVRAGRKAPHRAEINTAKIKESLNDLFFLDAQEPINYPFLVAGSRTSAFFGHPLKDVSFLSLWDKADQSRIISLLEAATQQLVPIVAQIESAALEPLKHSELPLSFELMLLPIAPARNVSPKLMGALVPMNLTPVWTFKTVASLRLHMARIIQLTYTVHEEETEDDALIEENAAPRRYGHLLVFDGDV